MWQYVGPATVKMMADNQSGGRGVRCELAAGAVVAVRGDRSAGWLRWTTPGNDVTGFLDPVTGW